MKLHSYLIMCFTDFRRRNYIPYKACTIDGKEKIRYLPNFVLLTRQLSHCSVKLFCLSAFYDSLCRFSNSLLMLCSWSPNMATALRGFFVWSKTLAHVLCESVTAFAQIVSHCRRCLTQVSWLVLPQYWLLPHGGRHIPITAVPHYVHLQQLKAFFSVCPFMLRETKDHPNIWWMSLTDISLKQLHIPSIFLP